MLLKQRVKFTRAGMNGKRQYATVEICGRTKEELLGRIEKQISRRYSNDWVLR